MMPTAVALHQQNTEVDRNQLFGDTDLTTNDPNLMYLVNQALDDLSFYDIAELNADYQCTESCPEGPKCANGGLMQNKGSCQCVCPWGLTEPVCQSLDTSPDREKKDNILLIKINIKT